MLPSSALCEPANRVVGWSETENVFYGQKEKRNRVYI